MFYDGTSEVALGVWARETGSVDQPWFAQVLTPGQLLGCSWLCHSSVPRTGASSLLPTFWLLPISCPGPSSWCPVFVDLVSHSKLLISMSCVPAAHQELVLGGTASSKTNPGLLEHQHLWATFLSWRHGRLQAVEVCEWPGQQNWMCLFRCILAFVSYLYATQFLFPHCSTLNLALRSPHLKAEHAAPIRRWGCTSPTLRAHPSRCLRLGWKKILL